jgi:anthranilate synthase component I
METPHFQTFELDSIPDLFQLSASFPERYPHLLASSAQGNTQARYDILFACPQNTLAVNSLADLSEISFLNQLDQLWQQERLDWLNTSIPFTGGWFIYLGYEAVVEIEPGLKLPQATDGLPVAFAMRCPAAIIIDHEIQQAYIICETEYEECLQKIKNDLIKSKTSCSYRQPVNIDKLHEDNAEQYLNQVERIKHYILEGDVFQVNLSRAWHTKLSTPINNCSLFYRLIQSNPGPFNALVNYQDQAIVSSSPERLIEVKNNRIETRPIAGTRPRSSDEEADQALSKELLAHPKERAEHIMLIDLERNDLGRICKPGTVAVNELMVLETYKHVHHIVSNVRGELQDNVTPGEIIKAVFPGGTITGCPKVRCMEILAELEKTGRGAYTGSLGYLNRDGSMDLNILIRTITRDGNKLSFRAGGGIVADSEPQHELEETRSKAKGLIKALTNVGAPSGVQNKNQP